MIATLNVTHCHRCFPIQQHGDPPTAVSLFQTLLSLGRPKCPHPLIVPPGPYALDSLCGTFEPRKDAVGAGSELCGGGEMAVSIASSIDRLVDGDEAAAIFKQNPGELMVRHI